MNEKIQAILLRIVRELQKLKWSAGQDWEITLRSEGHVPLVKQVSVEGSMDDDEWRDDVETHIDLRLASDDQITFFPNYTIYAQIFIEGGDTKDVVYKLDADVAFTEKDVMNERKASLAATRIDRLIDDHMQEVYIDYVGNNAEQIKYYKQGGWKADDEEARDR